MKYIAHTPYLNIHGSHKSWPWPWFSPYPTGHIGPHSDAIRACQELPPLLPPRWTPSFVGLCWLRPYSLLLVDLVLSCILVPASTVLAVVCAGGPYGRHVQASEVVFLSVIVHGLLSSSGSDLHISYPVFPWDAQYTPLPSVMCSIQTFC